MSDMVDVAVIGAGPYGLSVAAHLRAADVDYRHFGTPMHLWQAAMPKGMFLKSQGFASNLSDPAGTHTLEAFCQATGRPYASYGLPVPLDTFVSYGQWFQSELGLPVEEVLVTGLAPRDGGFELNVGGVERVLARKVVVAIGVEHFAYVPAPLSELPPALCTHSSAHADLAAFSGREVIVVGAGQSALESAALLHENGAPVQVLARESQVAWNGEPLALDRPLPQRMREPESGLGSGWATWFYSNHPELFRHLPQSTRVYRARTALGPAGASWLRSRVEEKFPVLLGQAVTSADSAGRQGAPGRHRGRRGQPRAGLRPRDRGHGLPHRPGPAGLLVRGDPVQAAHPGREPGGGPRLPVVRPRALFRRHGGGTHHGTGHALRLRHAPCRARGGPPGSGRPGPEGRSGRSREPVVSRK